MPVVWHYGARLAGNRTGVGKEGNGDRNGEGNGRGGAGGTGNGQGTETGELGRGEEANGGEK